MKIGIIGAGFIARKHIAALLKLKGLVEIVGIYSKSGLGRVKNPKGNLGGDEEIPWDKFHWFTSAEELISSPDVEVVLIATTTDTQEHLTRMCIAARKHVMCEKPMARNSSELVEFIACIRKAQGEWGFKFLPLMPLNHWWEFQWIKDHFEGSHNGQPFGDFQSGHIEYEGDYPTWNTDFYLNPHRSGSGLVDLSIHPLTWIQTIRQIDDVRVQYRGQQKIYADSSAIDFAKGELVLAHKTGAFPTTIEFRTGWSAGADFNIDIFFCFEGGSILFDLNDGLQVIWGYDDGIKRKITSNAPGCYEAQMQYAVQFFGDATKTPSSDFLADLLAGHQLVERIKEAAVGPNVEEY